jgi:hypothetical protein
MPNQLTLQQMTEHQIKSIRIKIEKIKKALAADKKKWGGQHDDSRGLRYLPPAEYLKLQDYRGALRYFYWFDKTFPDDIGFPFFLFEWTITLFYNSKTNEARRMVYRTFFSNTYLLNKFFDRPIVPVDKWEGSNLENSEYIKGLPYSKDDTQLSEFTDWIRLLMDSDEFKKITDTFIDLNRQLKNVPSGDEWSDIIRRINLIENVL